MIHLSGFTRLKCKVTAYVLPRSKKLIMNFIWYKETCTNRCNNFTIQLVSNKFSHMSPRGEKVSSVKRQLLQPEQLSWHSSK